MNTPLLDQVVERSEGTGIVRYRDGRIAGGVARGLAARFDIDPVVVRVAFVVATFAGGLGVAAYLLCWFLLPDDQGVVPLRAAARDRDAASMGLALGTTLATIAAIASISSGRDSGRFIGLIAVAGLVWYVVRRKHTAPAAEPDPQAATDPSAATVASGTTSGTTGAGPVHPAGQGGTMPVITPWSGRDGDPAVVHPASAPLGAHATNPQPTRVVAPAPPRPRRRSLGFGLWLVAIGVAVVSWIVSHAIAVSTGHDEVTAGLVALGAATAALGLLILAVGVRGYRTSGLSVPVLVLALVAASGQTALSVAGPDAAMGDVSWQPAGAADLRTDYSVGMGTGKLDLTKVSAADLGGRTIAAKAGMGELGIRVPDDVRVEVVPHVRLGEIKVTDGSQVHTFDGVEAGRNTTVLLGSGDRTLRLEATAGLGEIRVDRVRR